MRRRQEGITLLGFIVVLIVFMGIGYFAMRLIPMYTEYYQVKSALKGVIQEPGIGQQNEIKIRDYLSRRFDIGYVSSIEPKDVKIKRNEGGLTLSVDYEVRKPLAYNVDLIAHFEDAEGADAGKLAKDAAAAP